MPTKLRPASRFLLAHYRGSEMLNELLHDESATFRADVKVSESDHAPVIAKHCNKQSQLEADGDTLCHPLSPL
jgi:hypothetical protein